jgi:hypothetical protein
MFERLVLISKVDEVARRNARTIHTIANVPPHPDESIRLWVRKRLKHNCIDKTEDRGVRSDAERKRDQRNDREAWSLQQAAKSVANVFDYGVHHFARLFCGFLCPIRI